MNSECSKLVLDYSLDYLTVLKSVFFSVIATKPGEIKAESKNS